MEPIDDEVAPHRSKKNTKRWCKGRPGREHTPAMREKSERAGWMKAKCEPWPYGLSRGNWWCQHELICSTCGKVLRWTMGDDCPEKPIPDG